jgi:hypothetical protein
MLEEKLADLYFQISALTVAVEKLTAVLTPRTAPEPIPALEPAPTPKPIPVPAPEPTLVLKSAKMISIDFADAKPVDDDDDKSKEVSIDVLRDICMRLVREKPGIKPTVMKLIFSFNKAEKVQDVPVADRPALLTALELL